MTFPDASDPVQAAHAARVYCEASLVSIASGSPFLVPVDAIDYDTDGFFDAANHALKIPAGWPSGLYACGLMVGFSSNPTGARRAALHPSWGPAGVDDPCGDHRGADPNGSTLLALSGETSMNAGDSVTLWAQQISGASLNLLGGAWWTSMWIDWRGWL